MLLGQSQWAKPPEAEGILAFRMPHSYLIMFKFIASYYAFDNWHKKWPLCKKKVQHIRWPRTFTLRTVRIKYCVWARGSRSNCSACYARGNVNIRFIESEFPHSGRGTIIDPHTAKQKSKICPGVTPPNLQLQGSGGYRRRGNKTGREDRGCNGWGKRQSISSFVDAN